MQLQCPAYRLRGPNQRPNGSMRSSVCNSNSNSSSSTSRSVDRHDQPLVYVIMGVSGCGKSTVGQLLANKLQCAFYDADSYHPQQNISKMQAGFPLTDADRWPWLEKLKDILARHIAESQPAVMACSALKPAYRQLLRSAAEAGQQQQQQQQQQVALPQPQQQIQATAQHAQGSPPGAQLVHQEQPVGSDPIVFVLVNPPRAVLEARLQVRAAAGAHFMPASLLDSQLEQLEVPDRSELYMCFGSLPDACNLQGQSGSDGMESCKEPAAAAAAAHSVMSYPSSQEIVAAILGGVGRVNL